MSAVIPILALGLFLTIQCFQIPSPSLLKASRSLFEKREGDRLDCLCYFSATFDVIFLSCIVEGNMASMRHVLVGEAIPPG